MVGNWRKYKKIQPGGCHGNPGCPNPAGKNYYCPRHRALYRKAQNARRAVRRQMGFCVFCREPAAPGYTRCTRHRLATAAVNQRNRDKKAAARGWKVIRVPILVGEAANGKRRPAGGPR